MERLEAILYNVLGGFIVVGLIKISELLTRNLARRRFKRVFGSGSQPIFLVYGSMRVDPFLLDLVPSEHDDLKKYPLSKPSDPSFHFSAENSASACEVRAASYLASSMGRYAGIGVCFESDENLSARLNVDFVSFGGLNNLKSKDAFNNEANDLIEFDPKAGFVFRGDGRPIASSLPEHDHGIILKIHPRQFPERTWVVCAGVGEWGTSGSAWFLANKWKEIESAVKSNSQFCCSIRVKTKQDESAEALEIRQSS